MPLKKRLPTLYKTTPEPGKTQEVAPFVHWVCMPMPFLPGFVNCWLLESEDGFTLVDTGVNNTRTRTLWKQILEQHCSQKPLRRLIITHYHPDHIGLAGWFTQEYNVQLHMTQIEWLYARALFLLSDAALGEIMVDFYRRCDCEDEFLRFAQQSGNTYAHTVSPIPHSFRRIRQSQELLLTHTTWQSQCSAGHSPAQLTLHNPMDEVMITSDEILPHITPNISVWPDEPFANPLQDYLDSLQNFEHISAETTMLPAHGYPTKDLPFRLKQLAHHHDGRLEKIYNSCKNPQTASEVASTMLGTEVGLQQVFFAIGEAVAHLNYLVEKGELVRSEEKNNIWRYSQS
ncbi:MAG: MBL fold metallo-hydrolase [Deferribacteres bacterium]|nr:MBL fold metallo-hydrolase [Deferribacteres bacterium]